MKNHIAVIGLGRFGSSLALSLSENKCEVIAIDKDEERVKAVSDHVAMAVVLDALDEKALREVGIKSVDLAVVSIGENVEANILAVMLLKELGIENIIAKAVTDLHGKVLSQLQVSKVVYPERDMAERLATTILQPDIIESIELSEDHSIVETPAPEFMWNKSIRDTNLRAEYGLNIIAIKQPPKESGEPSHKLIINPAPSTVIKREDVLVVLGTNEDIERMRKTP
jgi:trk system potassium uptake protein TrkA